MTPSHHKVCINGKWILVTDLSDKEKALEVWKCKSDFVYFVENYCFVNTGSGYELLALAAKQKEMCRRMIHEHKLLILGSRQTGKTTLMVCFCAWAMLFYRGLSITFISRKQEQAKEQMVDIEVIFEHLPDFLRPTLMPNQTTKKTVVETGSTIAVESVLSNPESKGRGLRSHIVWIDESAFLKTLSPLLTALLPTTAQRFIVAEQKRMPYGIFLTTTPNGKTHVGERFFKMWTEAEDAREEAELKKDPTILKRSSFRSFKIHWSDLPFYDEVWYEEQKRQFGKSRIREFHQEYDLSFIGGEDTWLDDDTLVKFQSKVPIRKEGKIWVWEEPMMDKQYVIAVDVATAFGKDFSAIQVIDLESMDQVAEFIDKLPIESLSGDYCLVQMIELIADMYQNSIISFERAGVGNSLEEKLPYNNKLRGRLYQDKIGGSRWGYKITPVSRKQLFEELYTVISERPDGIRSSRLIKEIGSLTTGKGGKVSSGSTQNDDAVLAMAQAYVIRN